MGCAAADKACISVIRGAFTRRLSLIMLILLDAVPCQIGMSTLGDTLFL